MLIRCQGVSWHSKEERKKERKEDKIETRFQAHDQRPKTTASAAGEQQLEFSLRTPFVTSTLPVLKGPTLNPQLVLEHTATWLHSVISIFFFPGDAKVNA